MSKCIVCGTENPSDQMFCSECGMRLPAESTGGETKTSVGVAGANAEQLAAYKSEAMVVLKAGSLNLMSRRRLKMLQKRLGLSDAQAQDAEKEILAEIERMKAEEQQRAMDDGTGSDGSDSECDGGNDEDDDSYQEVFDRVKGCLEQFGYYPEVDEDDGTVTMAMDDDGHDRMLWNSVREFLFASWDDHHANFNEPGCVSLFKAAFYWEDCGDRVIPKVGSFMEACGFKFSHGVFEDMDEDTPIDQIMEFLDEAEISADPVDDGDDPVAIDDDDSDAVEDDDSEEDMSEDEGDSDCETSKSSRCSLFLESSGDDKDAVARALCARTKRTFEEARKLVEGAPIPLHLDMARDEAEEIAFALRKVGATVEISDHDAGTTTHGSCSVVLQKIPARLGRLDMMVISTDVAKLLSCMPANAFKMLDDLPLTLAENVSREEADEIVTTFKKHKCVVEVVGGDEDEAPSGESNGDIDFDSIREYIQSFDEEVGCSDMVLPDDDRFEKKWNNLSGVVENEFDVTLDFDNAFVVIDCTVFGSAKKGVLISQEGIGLYCGYSRLDGWLNWGDFKASGHITKIDTYEVKVLDDPVLGINVAGCGLSADDTMKFFNGLLKVVRGNKALAHKESQEASMPKCSGCGADLKPGAKFCNECGAPVRQTKTCPKCGAAQQPGVKFCSECGASVLSADR